MFFHRLIEMPDQGTPRDRAAFGKLTVSLAHIWYSAQPGNDPLPDITAQMQNDIAGRIRNLVWTPPYVFFAQ